MNTHPTALTVEQIRDLEIELLPNYFARARWFAGKARGKAAFSVEEVIFVGPAFLLFVRVQYADAGSETYLLPIAIEDGDAPRPEAATVVGETGQGVLVDAVHSAGFRAEIFGLMAKGTTVRTDAGELAGIAGEPLRSMTEEVVSRVLTVEQSNSSIVFGDQIFFKLYRKLEDGLNPDAEITRFLTERRGFTHVPPFAGAVEYRRPGSETRALGLALGLVHNRGDAWTMALAELGAYFDRVRSHSDSKLPQLLGSFPDRAAQLGSRTGEMHRALSGDPVDPAFCPETLTGTDRFELANSVRQSAREIFDLLRKNAAQSQYADIVGEVLEHESAIEDLLTEGSNADPGVTKIRIHGDYHLGQVLDTGDDFIIIDFEGEPLRSLAERRRKRSPLKDVAGMLRSFHYAAYASLADAPGDKDSLAPYAEEWARLIGKRFLDGWRAASQGASFCPASDSALRTLLNTFLLEKAIYEVRYEMNNRPAWLPIPLRGILSLFEGQ